MKKSCFIYYAVVCVAALSYLLPSSAFSQSPDREIVIGLKPEQNIFRQADQYRILGEYLTKKTGKAIRFNISTAYRNELEDFIAGKVDGAVFGSFTGVIAHEQYDAHPLVRPVTPDGKSTYHGHIFVRKDSGIRTVQDMKGKVMVFVARANACGYYYPLAYLRKNGIQDVNAFFREHFFSGSHDAAINAVLNKAADVGVAKNPVFEAMKKQDPRIENELMILDESPEFPSSGLFLKKDFDPELAKKLREVLLGMDEDREGQKVLQKLGAMKFIDTSLEENYRHVYEIVKTAGTDLKTYDIAKDTKDN